MERISDWIRGGVELELFGAFPAGILNSAAAEGLAVWNVESAGENSVRFHTWEACFPDFQRLAEKGACELKILRRVGGRGARRRILHRPAFLIGLAAMAALLMASSLFVWDVQVRGTDKVSRARVLRTLEDCGFGVGSFWPGLNTEILRSEVLLRLPEIGWMTVNVSGSRAVVAVVERMEKPEMYEDSAPWNLVASRDALVRRGNALAGHPAVKEGQIVTKGQLLIGGDLESLTGEKRRVRAKGAVMADTWYEISAVCPEKELLKTPAGVPHSRFALIVGKKRVNLYIGCGKTIDGCDKIISEHTLGLEGLFSTPIRLVHERFIPYKSAPGDDYDPGGSGRRLYALLEQRTEGQILSHILSPGKSGEMHVLTLRAHCLENIAQPAENG